MGVKRVLVLGSAGQIGTYLVETLRQRGYFVDEFDIARNEKEDLRIEKNSVLEELVKESDYVFFLAFDVGGSGYLEQYQNSFHFISNNMRLMENTFQILEKYKKDFVFASSQMSNMTFSTYGVLKLIGEKYVQSLPFGRTVHFWNVYGFESEIEKFHVISDFAIMAKFNGLIKMRTSGSELRDFLYAVDCCEALVQIMEKHQSISKTDLLHLTSFKSTSIKQIANIIAGRYKAKIQIGEKTDFVQQDARNQADPFILSLWQPKTPIEEGISNILDKIDASYFDPTPFFFILKR